MRLGRLFGRDFLEGTVLPTRLKWPEQLWAKQERPMCGKALQKRTPNMISCAKARREMRKENLLGGPVGGCEAAGTAVLIHSRRAHHSQRGAMAAASSTPVARPFSSHFFCAQFTSTAMKTLSVLLLL
jgi:hypothetical protein